MTVTTSPDRSAALAKAATLVEALPWLARFHGAVVVLKYGGHAMDNLAVQAATGDLTAIHDYTITATEAAVATQLTTAVRNKALEAFQEIMRMSI